MPVAVLYAEMPSGNSACELISTRASDLLARSREVPFQASLALTPSTMASMSWGSGLLGNSAARAAAQKSASLVPELRALRKHSANVVTRVVTILFASVTGLTGFAGES